MTFFFFFFFFFILFFYYSFSFFYSTSCAFVALPNLTEPNRNNPICFPPSIPFFLLVLVQMGLLIKGFAPQDTSVLLKTNTKECYRFLHNQDKRKKGKGRREREGKKIRFQGAPPSSSNSFLNFFIFELRIFSRQEEMCLWAAIHLT